MALRAPLARMIRSVFPLPMIPYFDYRPEYAAIQAAVLRVKLRRLDETFAVRRRLAARHVSRLTGSEYRSDVHYPHPVHRMDAL